MRWVLVIASILGALSVMIGATMRHISTNANMDILQTALKYHQLYSVVLLATGLYAINKTSSWKIRLAPILFTSGIIIFSGSLYLMAFLNLTFLGMATPIGGVLLIAGWASLGFIDFSKYE